MNYTKNNICLSKKSSDDENLTLCVPKNNTQQCVLLNEQIIAKTNVEKKITILDCDSFHIANPEFVFHTFHNYKGA